MSLQGTIKRYSLIIDYARRTSYPSFKEIHELLHIVLAEALKKYS
jgi:hypothetical protein